jgi:hypothetical protein
MQAIVFGAHDLLKANDVCSFTDNAKFFAMKLYCAVLVLIAR